jgi:hypothetical protein
LKLRARTRRGFYFIFWTLFATGSAIWFFDRWVRVPGAFGEEHSSAQPWIARAHTLSAYGMMVVFGYLLHSHVRPGLKGKRSKPSGISMISVFAILAASSLPVLYAGEGATRNVSSWLHIYLGLSIPLFLAAHLYGRAKNES